MKTQAGMLICILGRQALTGTTQSHQDTVIQELKQNDVLKKILEKAKEPSSFSIAGLASQSFVLSLK